MPVSHVKNYQELAGSRRPAYGWALSLGGRDPDLAAVAVPLFNASGTMLCALTLSDLLSRFSAEKIDEVRTALFDEVALLRSRLSVPAAAKRATDAGATGVCLGNKKGSGAMSSGQSRSRRQFVAATIGLPFLLGNRAADAADPTAREWIVPDLLAPARTEGGLTVYSSTNEQEALPVWKVFEDATGIKVNYVRGADASLIGRVAIEARAGQQSWDLLNTPTVNQVPTQFLAPVDLPEAAAIIPSARAPDKRWHGSYGNYNSPAFNTKLLTPAQLPRGYEGFLDHPEWAGKVAIEGTDREWLYAILQARGETEGRKLVREIVARLKPVLVDGHLALARAVSAGEYPLALNNYTMLTLNMRLAGGPTDFWAMDPVTLFFGAVGVNPKAPHPNAARLGANFMLSREAQTMAATTGRLPTRPDVASNPPDAIGRLTSTRVIAVNLAPEDSRRWQKTFRELMQAQ